MNKKHFKTRRQKPPYDFVPTNAQVCILMHYLGTGETDLGVSSTVNFMIPASLPYRRELAVPVAELRSFQPFFMGFSSCLCGDVPVSRTPRASRCGQLTMETRCCFLFTLRHSTRHRMASMLSNLAATLHICQKIMYCEDGGVVNVGGCGVVVVVESFKGNVRCGLNLFFNFEKHTLKQL
jgi:hypothetical protein